MKLDYRCPVEYKWWMPLLNGSDKVTERVRNGLENVLSVYVEVAKTHADETDNNSKNYFLSQVYLVGSGARENKIDSDLDLLLIAPRLDEESAKQMKLILSFIFFNDRPKQEAIDLFVRQKDIYPDRKSIEITKQVKGLLSKCNGVLL
ncbi:MAG: nucleotidyltransferase domain-containing protein [Nanoarchaeota archaeon]|nr:nucleotidyltransferase domain-containing protein [Nanoarchaeota archaeon]